MAEAVEKQNPWLRALRQGFLNATGSGGSNCRATWRY